MEKLEIQLREDKKKRKPTVTVEKPVSRICDLPEVNTLALDKQTSLNNYLRDVIFTGLKYITNQQLESGKVMGKMMENLQLTTETQKTNYKLHLTLALKMKIAQIRNNTIKNIKWKYRLNQGNGEGKIKVG